MDKKKIFKSAISIMIIGMFLFFAFGSAKDELKEGETYCMECDKHFKIGEGYNTDGYNQYGKPDNEYSHFCSPECAYKDVQKKK